MHTHSKKPIITLDLCSLIMYTQTKKDGSYIYPLLTDMIITIAMAVL